MYRPNRKKHIVLLALGIAATVIARCFTIRNPNVYTAGALALIILSPVLAYFGVLGIMAFIVAAIRKNVKRLWLPILAWMFLAAGLFDLAVKGYAEFILRPQVDQGIQELIASGKLDLSRQTEQESRPPGFDTCTLKISMPGKPEIKSERYPKSSYGMVGSETFSLSTREAVYAAACFDYDPGFLQTSSVDDIFAFSKFSALSSFGGPIIDDKKIEHQGVPGREIILIKSKDEPGMVYMRMFFRNRTLYNLTLIVPEGSPIDVEQWFDTLELPTT